MKTVRLISIFVISMTVFALGLGLFSPVYAYPASGVYGRSEYKGYFFNTKDYYGTKVLPTVAKGTFVSACGVNNDMDNAIPNCINQVNELIYFLQTYNKSSNKQQKTGSAFIVYTMLGRDGGNYSKTVSQADWDDLSARLTYLQDEGKINWTANVSSSVNSYYQGTGKGTNPDDDAYYDEYKNESGITFFNNDGSYAYKLVRRCANPIGNFDGIPPSGDYDLTPVVSLNPDSIIESGSSITVRPSVGNSGTNSSDPADWVLDKTINGVEVDPIANGVDVIFPIGNKILPNVVDGDTNYSAGTHLCYTLSVTPHSNSDGGWVDSQEVCVVIGKAPKVQIWGGDLWTRSNVQTGSSLKNISGTNRMFGSWVEYGIFAGGRISGTASGSAFAGGLENPPTACSYSTLSFANTPPRGSMCTAAPDTIGRYATSRSMPDVAASFPTTSSPTFASGKLDGKQGVYKTSSNVTISGSTIAKGQWVVINAPTATVTINGNISYTGETLHSINDIPQVVIIANKIIINNGVTNVDSWLIANSSANPYVQTCTAVARTVGECNAPLIINGPVIATKLYLYRTAGSGSGAASGDPAEVINLRADAYLWAYARAVNGSRVQTVYMTELPPRL